VVVEELIPEASTGKHSNLSTIGFAIGFVLMMVLDVVMGWGCAGAGVLVSWLHLPCLQTCDSNCLKMCTICQIVMWTCRF